MITAAEVVVVSHFQDGASLEVHRIDRMLAMGKVVVAVASTDAALDDIYREGVVLVDSEDELPGTLVWLLSSPKLRSSIAMKARAWWRNRVRQSEEGRDGLCSAIEQISALAIADGHGVR